MQSQDVAEVILIETHSLMQKILHQNPDRFSSVTLHAVIATHIPKR